MVRRDIEGKFFIGIRNALFISIPFWLTVALVIWLASDCVHRPDVGYSPDELAKGRARMADVARNLKGGTLDDVRGFMSFFEYIPQYYNYTPTVEDVFTAELHGNCQAAAVLGAWALAQTGRSARVWLLTGGGWGYPHTIALTDDKTVFITNDLAPGYGGLETVIVKEISPTDWKNAVLNHFTPPYKRIGKYN